MELRLGFRVIGSTEYIIWSAGEPRPAADAAPAGTAAPAGVLELPPDPGYVARIRRELGLPVAVEAAPTIAGDCVRAGAEVLVGDRCAVIAARTGAALLCHEPAAALRAGVRADGVIVDAGTAPAAPAVERLVGLGHPVLVTLASSGSPAPPAEGGPEGGPEAVEEPSPSDPGMLATASVYAWLGARIFRVRPQDVRAVGQVLDMVASIQGTRPPTLTRRGLA